MKPRHYGVDVEYGNEVKLICSCDEEILTFVEVADDPEIFYSIDEAVFSIIGELDTKRKLAFTALFCLKLFDSLQVYENNLSFPPSS